MTSDVSSWGFAEGDQISSELVALRRVGGGYAYEAFLAFDERLYAATVVKVVRPRLVDDPATMEGFAREVEMLGQLNHPSIVRMFSYDAEATHPHIVLENIDGPSLSKLINKHGALPLPQLLPLGIELGAAAHYLAGRGVCHLDIKPSNIIMGAPAKLIDLSVAMGAADAVVTDHPVGSDEYMAPEQCVPSVVKPMSSASDMWGIGATMFRAAAGYRAFDRGMAAGRWPQVDSPPHDLPRTVPTMLAELIMACLNTEPAERPEPAAFVDALEPMMASLPTARLSGFKISL